MAEVLEFGYTAIRDWVLNLQILLLVGVVLVGALHCFVSELSRYSQSAKIFKQGQVLTRAIKPRAEANLSFRANEHWESARLALNGWGYGLPGGCGGALVFHITLTGLPQ